MPEYRRFVAYFYEYIDGKKQGNAGFAKVELRNGMWRILFRLTAVSNPEPPVQVYGFVREKGYLLGMQMGTMRSGSVMMEEWAYRAGTPLWHQKYGVSDLAGIWIQTGAGNCYVTLWDDMPIDTDKFVLELPANDGGEMAAEKKENRTEPGSEARREAAQQSSYMAGEQAAERMSFVMTDEEAAEQPEIAAVVQEQPGIVAAAGEAEKQSDTGKTGEWMIPGISGQEVAECAVSGNAATSQPDTAAGDSADQVLLADQIPSADQELSADRVSAAEQPSPAAENAGAAAMSQRELRMQQMQRCRENLWRELSGSRQHFMPFGDETFRDCIQIRPCDLIRLQQAGLQIGRSSFLLHGFYQYHHLLLGVTESGDVVIGVPGLLNPQERYMAQMFGFGSFKTAARQDHNRQFGYWQRTLQPGIQPGSV